MFKEEWTSHSPPPQTHLSSQVILYYSHPPLLKTWKEGGEECVNVILHLCVQDSCANSALAVKLVFIVEGLPHGSLVLLFKFQNFSLLSGKYIQKHAELQSSSGDLSSLGLGLCSGGALEGFTQQSKC